MAVSKGVADWAAVFRGVRRFGAVGADVGWVTCPQRPCDLG
jgi:hypothetical protein